MVSKDLNEVKTYKKDTEKNFRFQEIRSKKCLVYSSYSIVEYVCLLSNENEA